MINEFKRFYNSSNWIKLSNRLKVECNYTCYECNQFFTTTRELIAHHKTELTESNIHDTNITLNPTNISIICIDCHNRGHNRFGYHKKVYVVWGSPLAGKREYVNNNLKHSDIVLDIKKLYKAIGINQNDYIKFNVFELKDRLMDNIKTRYGNWTNAFIIGGYPNEIERNLLIKKLKAESIYIESTQDECIDRANGDKKQIEYVREWWEKYSVSPPV